MTMNNTIFLRNNIFACIPVGLVACDVATCGQHEAPICANFAEINSAYACAENLALVRVSCFSAP